jgi:hypothetical protein
MEAAMLTALSWVLGSLAFADTTAVLVNATGEPLDPEFVLIGRTVCDACSGVIPPNGARTVDLGDASRLIVDVVGPVVNGSMSLRFSGNGRSFGSSGANVEQSWMEVGGDQIVTLVFHASDARRGFRSRGRLGPACGSMTQELAACTPTVCEEGRNLVMIEALSDGGCLLKQQEKDPFRRGGGLRVLRCEARTAEARSQLVDLFEVASTRGVWPQQELASSPLCQDIVDANPAVGQHLVLWMNQSTTDVQIGSLGSDCDGCQPRRLEPGATASSSLEPGTLADVVPISGDGLDLFLDLSKGGLRTELVGDRLQAQVVQQMGDDMNTTSVVVVTDAP